MKFLLISMALLTGLISAGQTLSLAHAQEQAEKNYPAISRKSLIAQTAAISIENLQKGFLPQVSVSAQASYQSDVTQIPISLPGLNIQSPSKDQYRILTDISQLVYDGGITKAKKELQQLNAAAEQQKLELELYQVREKINQLFLGILLIDQQLKQVALLSEDIQTGINRVEAQLKNGTAFRSALDLLKAELLKTGQRNIELTSARKGWIDALSLFMGEELPMGIKLLSPDSFDMAIPMNRPELKLFEQQSLFLNAQKKLVDAGLKPRASIFSQAGYARPGLNMLKNEFAFYYIAGLRWNWSFSNFYTRKKEKEQIEVNKKTIETQKQSFLLQSNAQLLQQQAEIDKFKKLIASDREIVELRHNVTMASKAQLENAVITANDYLLQVNAEDQARQIMIYHQIQLIQARVNYQTTLGGKF